MTDVNAEEPYRAPAVFPPSFKDLEDISTDLGFKCTEGELKAFKNYSEGVIAGNQRLYQLTEEQLPVKYPRCPGHREEKDNSWYWRCDIKGAEKGKLAGRTIGIKDNVAVAGIPMMNGSKLMEGYTPEFDATIVTRILDAGGNITGKTVCEDLLLSGSSWTSSTGSVTNPYDATRTSGGSSSGSASLVARGEVDMAIGSDQGGSIRIPSSWCGLVGLKPTWGLVPYTGAMSVELTIDHLGPITRTVKDCATLLEVVAGSDEGRDPRQPANLTVPEYSVLIEKGITGKRIGVLKEGFNNVDMDVCDLVRKAAERLTEAGAIVEDMSIPLHKDGPDIWVPITFEGSYNNLMKGNGNGYMWKGYYPLSMQEAFARGKSLRPQDMSLTAKYMFTMSEYMTRNYQNKFYAKGQNLSRVLTQAYDDALQNYDVFIMPTLPGKAFKLPTKKDSVEDILQLSLGMVQNTAPSDATGHPALTINTGFSEGLPVGMMIVGRMFDEVTILQVARAYEKIRDGH